MVTLVIGDITTFEGGALVNAANPRMTGGGGVDGAIHRAAGPELVRLCTLVPTNEAGIRCHTGDVRPVPARTTNLKVDWVLCTVGPVVNPHWVFRPGETRVEDPKPFLQKCYTQCLVMAKLLNLKSIAFPAISTGAYGASHEDCAEAAMTAFTRCPTDLDVSVYLFSGEGLGEWTKAATKHNIHLEMFKDTFGDTSLEVEGNL